MQEKNYKKDAKELVHLLMDGKTHKELVESFKKIGIIESEQNLINKINRGTFSIVFLLQLCKALNIDLSKLVEKSQIQDGSQSNINEPYLSLFNDLLFNIKEEVKNEKV